MKKFFNPERCGYRSLQGITNRRYVCGYCSDKVSSSAGYKVGKKRDGGGDQIGGIYICSNCQGPTFFSPDGRRYPAQRFGRPVEDVPADLSTLYDEARRCTGESCFTAAVLCCRKILMHIAVEQGADEGKRFIEYVEYLVNEGYAPPQGQHWVDHIRQKGNEANHEIVLMESDDAQELLTFIEMLLRFNYEFPAAIPAGDDEEVEDDRSD